MCEFISAIKIGDDYMYLTGKDLKTSRGRKMRERIGADVCGHGAIREYFDIAPGVGEEFECEDFSTPDNFPAKIVADINAGAFRGIGVARELLTAAAWVECDNACTAALAECDNARIAALAEYVKACTAALAECDKVRNRAFWDLFANPDNRPEAWR